LNFKLKTGTDLIIPQSKTDFPIPFLQADFYNLPFKNNSYDIILLRFVVEHIEQPKQALTEFFRVLKPEGKILIMTTNLISPIIFLPKLLPYSLRRKLIQKLFAAGEDDLFPTFHYLNTKRAFENYSDMFDIVDWKYIQDVNWNRKWLFGLFFTWHLLTRWFSTHFLRSNIITLLKSTKK
jgi:ubiquinone/menaquinone biosynthesis C-methylase UbiE